ncbi:phosphoglucosamine mutase [Agaribacterium haliotis]|uniref:phosphoglucosamine mutase n=1 Tax=Agaribacterium haliotis TaxID=2013869 RepID=UPI000BB5809B|nr:phosphoglucosamine mutase [Agaribacterium haliotis]
MARKYFGTDGIRGRVGDSHINPQFFLQLGWAVGKVLGQHGSRKPGMVLIGKDTRISGYMFESALEAGLIASGVDVGLLGPMPTPGIAYLTRTFQAKAGLVISASHNPFTDNGVKIFNTFGSKLADELELAIESQIDQPMVMASALGKARRIDDAEGRYVEFCKGSLPWGFSLEGMHIVLDCSNGATYSIAPKVFRELGAKVEVIANKPDGLNINFECGSTHTAQLGAKVLESGADLGIAFDGDGDRVLFVDHRGREVDGDQLIFIIASYRHRSEQGCEGVVGTLMTNYGFELAMKERGIGFERAKVGDRYVIERMAKTGWLIGGESSGHIVCKDLTTTGDGIISALQVLQALGDSGQSLADACAEMSMFPQHMINVPVNNRIDLDKHEGVQQTIREVEAAMAGRGRVLLRPSGTEPVIRVMVEGENRSQVHTLCTELADVVAQALA